MERHILIVDDDTELCGLIGDYLRPEGFHIECHFSGEGASDIVRDGDYSLLILDVMLPGKSGFDVLREIRQHSKIPVIMLTARGNDVDRIVGLEMGADDYMPKPFNPRELVARIRAVQRRAAQSDDPLTAGSGKHRALVVGDVTLDKSARIVTQAGKQLELTSVEFALLEELLRQAGMVVSRESLVRSVLKRKLSPYDRSIDVHICHLRRKLGPHDDQKERIITVRGTGYQYIVSPAGTDRVVG